MYFFAIEPFLCLFVNILGEGGEEVATTAILPWVKRAIYDPDAELPTAEQLVEAGIGGMIGGTIWEGAGLATSGKRMGQSIENTVHNTDNYDVDLAIGNIMDGKATLEDFKLFEPGNTENRRIFYELFDYKLPEDRNGTLLNLLYITNSNAVHKDFPLYFYNKHYGKRNSNLDLYLSDIYNEYISYLKNADGKQTSTEHIKTRNEKLEDKVHPVTSVPFVRKTITVNDRVYDVVVPEFESLFDAQIG